MADRNEKEMPTPSSVSTTEYGSIPKTTTKRKGRSNSWSLQAADSLDFARPADLVALLHHQHNKNHDAEEAAVTTTLPPWIHPLTAEPAESSSMSKERSPWVSYIVYALVNVIISLPGLYGYAAVIFSHDVFTPHMNALAKLVVFSSAIHQLGFSLFSSLPFAIGTVQDAGLIFLSGMSGTIANEVLASGGTASQAISTAVVLLPLGTAALGVVLIAMGYFRIADAVSYLPMPVVGGYLAFIGYFCLQAGTGLCLSESMTVPSDWLELLVPQKLLLAVPGLLAGLLLTVISRYAASDAALPAAMVAIPCAFYAVITLTGVGLEGARQGGWVGAEAPPVPVQDLFQLVKLEEVQWNLISEISLTWLGMVFVVSFASCLDVAAISMDQGEALDTNKELATVGICNVMSGLTFGFTGSYIFSQTIFTYRTGVHSKWIGILIIGVFVYVVTSPVNILQVAPLFFLGSTLIFIGYDLMYEWLIEIRTKIFLSEYIIVWATFICINIVGIDGGIVIGLLVAVVDHVVATATTTSVSRLNKKSRAVRSPEEGRVLQSQAYHHQHPKIVTLEVSGAVFFGSSMYLLERFRDELGIDFEEGQDESLQRSAFRSPHTPPRVFLKQASPLLRPRTSEVAPTQRLPPKFVVLDLSGLTNLDASASRGCFLQLAKLCAKKGIVVCAAAASPRTDWMLRSHGVAFELCDEEATKASILHTTESSGATGKESPDRLILFLNLYEALEFCENALLQKMNIQHAGRFTGFLPPPNSRNDRGLLSDVFARILSCSENELALLRKLDDGRYSDQIELQLGQEIFAKGTHPDAFYTVVKGAAAVALEANDPRRKVYRSRQTIVSGAGVVPQQRQSSSNLLDPSIIHEAPVVVASLWPVGGIVGYVDFLLHRPRTFGTLATQDKTVVARISHSQMKLIESEQPELESLLQRVLLKASLLDLANCTCDE